jgi:hypothetical protein
MNGSSKKRLTFEDSVYPLDMDGNGGKLVDVSGLLDRARKGDRELEEGCANLECTMDLMLVVSATFPSPQIRDRLTTLAEHGSNQPTSKPLWMHCSNQQMEAVVTLLNGLVRNVLLERIHSMTTIPLANRGTSAPKVTSAHQRQIGDLRCRPLMILGLSSSDDLLFWGLYFPMTHPRKGLQHKRHTSSWSRWELIRTTITVYLLAARNVKGQRASTISHPSHQINFDCLRPLLI